MVSIANQLIKYNLKVFFITLTKSHKIILNKKALIKNEGFEIFEVKKLQFSKQFFHFLRPRQFSVLSEFRMKFH